MNSIYFFTLLLGSYLVGSIPFGKLIGAARGIDVQQHGSGNIGFANCVRVLGWPAALLVLVGDTLKGYALPAFALNLLGSPQVQVLGLAAIIGSIFSPWVHWRGGKGVATLLGVSVALNPQIGLAAMVLWLAIVTITRTSSLASLAVAPFLLLAAIFTDPQLVLFYGACLFIILFTHRANMQRLVYGTEATLAVYPTDEA